jgi:hypothetical protein
MLINRVRPGLARARARAIEEEDERYNPIRPSNGNVSMRGGAGVSSSRSPRLSLADRRAMEIQQRHRTPGTGATPTMGVSEYRGGGFLGADGHGVRNMVGGSKTIKDMMASLQKTRGFDESQHSGMVGMLNQGQQMPSPRSPPSRKRKASPKDEIPLKQAPPLNRGRGGATPSMGVSQFRGGANENLLLNMSNVAQSGPYEGQGRMRGGKHMRDGHALSAHLMKTLGKANHRRLMGGMMAHCEDLHGGNWFTDAFAKVKNEFVNPDSVLRRGVSDAAQKTGHEFTDPNSILRGKVLPEAAKYASYAAPVLDVAGTAVGLPGAGTMLSRGLSAAQYANQGAKALGYGRGGKKRRAPAGASDGRRKRAEIVRKVMNERGVKMIEASKIVKSEGLY